MKENQKYALIGYPLGYSLSPKFHNTFFEKNNIDAFYTSVPLKTTELGQFVNSRAYQGFNVTIPYKETIMPFLDDVSDSAKAIGAVNTVKIKNKGYIGTNTDYAGFQLILKEELQMTMVGKKIIIYGAGGASRAIVYAALKQNASCITLIDIDFQKVLELKKHFNNDSRIKIYTLNDVERYLKENILPSTDILVNATPIGTEKTISKSVCSKDKLMCLSKYAVVIDIIYAPAKTKLLKEANELGLRNANGLGMLAGQGILAEKFWFGESLDYNTAINILKTK